MSEINHWSTDGETPYFQPLNAEVCEDLITIDGRSLVFYANQSLNELGGTNPNDLHIYDRLQYHGIIEFPEVEATRSNGEVLANNRAAYVDSRIGTTRLGSMTFPIRENPGWLQAYEPRLLGPNRELIPIDEINDLVDRGVKETGLDQQVAVMREEDASRAASTASYDLDALMRNMRDGKFQ